MNVRERLRQVFSQGLQGAFEILRTRHRECPKGASSDRPALYPDTTDHLNGPTTITKGIDVTYADGTLKGKFYPGE